MRKYLISAVICLICMAVFSPAAFAAVNLNSYSYYEFTYNRTFQDYVVDLDGDGVNEALSFSGDGFYINDIPTRILDFLDFPYVTKDKKERLFLVDFDKSDKRREIFSISYVDAHEVKSGKNVGFYEVTLYHYRKNRKYLITESFTEEYSHELFDVLSKYHYLGEMLGFRVPGNGRLVWRTIVYSSKNRNNKLYVELQFKRVNTPNKALYDPDYKFVLDITPTYKTTSKQKPIKAVSKLYVYKKASLKKNKLLFTLKKGKKYKPLKIKFGKKVTKIQIKAKGKKGWIFVPTKHMYF